MTQEELDKILEQHQHWIREDVDGWEGMNANLSGANLSWANLSEEEKFRLGKLLDEPLTGYKKTQEGVVITAEIPIGALLPDPPKPRRATNRELSRWLAQGNGECLGSQDDADTAWNYPQECSDTDVRDGAKVRKWSDTEWHEPTVEYLFGGDNDEA